ncbi:MAG: 6-bladed beta-propeller [Candidatus Omnitrophota bacterium]|nr:6-bladed beta-propeller [Candidatus Omnitrophota bacterium]
MFKPKLKNLFILLIFFFQAINCAFCAQEEARIVWPAAPSRPRIAFVSSIYSAQDLGIKTGFFQKLKAIIFGTQREILNKPMAVAVDKERAIYVCDSGDASVKIFKPKEKLYQKITKINNEELIYPVGIAVADDGRVFISDSTLKKVFCLDKKARYKFTIGQDKRFLRPTGLAVASGRLYVVDTQAHKVIIFDLMGNFILEFGARGKGEGEFNYPTSIAIDNENKSYIADTMNCRAQVFDKNNKFLYSLGQAGNTSGSFSRPKAVALDSEGHIYVADGIFDNIQIFSQKREFLLSVGESGHKDGEFWIPSGIAIDEDNYIYVADAYNQRIQVFRYIGSGQ